MGARPSGAARRSRLLYDASMRTRTPHFILLASALVLGCSSDDFTTAQDSGADSGADVASDVSTNDVSTNDVVNDSPAGTFCDTQTGAVFCEDFDKGAFTAGWMPDPNNNQPLPTIAATPTKSGNGSLKLVSAGADGGAGNFARYLRAVTPPSVTKSTLDAEMFIATTTIPALNVVVPLAFGLKDGQPGIPVALTLSATGWSCTGPNGAVKDQVGPIPINTWHHVKLEAFFTGGNLFDLACTVDNVTLTLPGVNATGHTGDRRLALGHNTSGSVGPTEIYIDNYVFRAQ